ncbi:hypothetical protein MUG91_G117n2 [Manis pentadactyla]|nr:hypothetical protein MUG91_G117n2 [Manis pentadactyla]
MILKKSASMEDTPKQLSDTNDEKSSKHDVIRIRLHHLLHLWTDIRAGHHAPVSDIQPLWGHHEGKQGREGERMDC